MGAPWRDGLVLTVRGPRVVVEADDGVRVDCKLRGRKLRPVCGDRVVWEPLEDGSGMVHRIQPRRSELVRHDVRKRRQVLAANVDRIWVMVAPEPELDPFIVDRYLAAAEAQEIPAGLVLNKTDLLGEDARRAVDERLAEFRELGYPMVSLSAKFGDNLDAIGHYLVESASVFVGQSGVGKSRLVNQLLGEDITRVGDISSATGEGKHTTTSATLYHLPGGGDIIDSPGVRDFALWPMPAEEVDRLFVEFKPLIPRCKFNDCNHRAEPGCAVKAAVDEGGVSPRRYESYRRLYRFMEEHYRPY